MVRERQGDMKDRLRTRQGEEHERRLVAEVGKEGEAQTGMMRQA